MPSHKKISLTGRYWSETPDLADAHELKKILESRKIRGISEVDFFNFLKKEFTGMKLATSRIMTAIENQERIMVFGDFDADGICSTTILVHGLKELGAKVSYRIPERHTDSHGLKSHHVDEIEENNVSLIITCDCGINEKDTVAYAKTKNIDVIITDHHTPDPDRRPDAVAIINPHCCENFKSEPLAGAAVCLLVVLALAEKYKKSPDFCDRYFEIAAIGIIADCVPLIGLNRSIVRRGLALLRQTRWPGLELFLERLNVSQDTIDENTIGFTIAPRLNAASRVGDVYTAAQLFLGDEANHFPRISALESYNQQRKEMTKSAVNQARKQVSVDAPIQILYQSDWNAGILGLVASKYCERLQVPVIAASLRSDGLISASCRSPEGVSMVKLLKNSAEIFTHFGGHDGAAGFVVDPNEWEDLRTELTQSAAEFPVEISPLALAGWWDFSPEDVSLYQILQKSAPFGAGNPVPIFGLNQATFLSKKSLGSDQLHQKLTLQTQSGEIEGCAFFCDHWQQKLQTGKTYDVAYTIEPNHWRGRMKLQMKIVDVR